MLIRFLELNNVVHMLISGILHLENEREHSQGLSFPICCTICHSLFARMPDALFVYYSNTQANKHEEHRLSVCATFTPLNCVHLVFFTIENSFFPPVKLQEATQSKQHLRYNIKHIPCAHSWDSPATHSTSPPHSWSWCH